MAFAPKGMKDLKCNSQKESIRECEKLDLWIMGIGHETGFHRISMYTNSFEI